MIKYIKKIFSILFDNFQLIVEKYLGITFIFLGLKVLMVQDFYSTWNMNSFSDYYLFIPASLIMFYVGYLFLKLESPKKEKKL